MFRGKREATRLRRLEVERDQYDAAVEVTDADRRRAEDFSEASLTEVERLAKRWQRTPDRSACAEELLSLVDRLRRHRAGQVL